MADLLQGFQLTIDANSGFGSLGNQMITYYLKDEAPKAPVFVYSINNQNQFDLINEEDKMSMDAEDIGNIDMMKHLGALNKSLFFSDL